MPSSGCQAQDLSADRVVEAVGTLLADHDSRVTPGRLAAEAA